MNEVEKFRADVRRVIKHDRADNGGTYDGMRACKKVAEYFCRSNRSIGGLPESIAEFWLEERIAPSSDMKEEPTEVNVDWLAAALSFLCGDADECTCFTASDWKKMGELVNYEAEDLPMELLSSLMGILVEKRAL